MWLPEVGLWHYKARAYSPGYGRFLQTDPIGTADDTNLYAYAGNDPVNLSDPSGMAAEKADKAWQGSMLQGAYNSARSWWDTPAYTTTVSCGTTCWKLGHTAPDGTSLLWQPEVVTRGGAIERAAILAPIGGTTVGSVSAAGRVGSLARAAKGAGAQLTGQVHHGISRTVHKALEAHPKLKGFYSVRDPRFVTQAKDLTSHRGYDTFHRNLDAAVAGWVRGNPNASQAQFELYLRGVYQRPDVSARFPNGI